MKVSSPTSPYEHSNRTPSLPRLRKLIIHCNRCPRLRTHCKTIAKHKRTQFRDETYWGKPVPGYGDPHAVIWIVGLAPGAHGANRTGRMFTGDSSGEWLYGALFDVGYATKRESISRTDGNILVGAYISSAARCAPPDNKPTPEELVRCSAYLKMEWEALCNVRVIVALGKIAYEAVKKLFPKVHFPSFGHGREVHIGPVTLLASYHPSRQNTQTGRLTREMWNGIFVKAKFSTQLGCYSPESPIPE